MKTTYVTARLITSGQCYFRALHTVSHQEALAILDPFQRNYSHSGACGRGDYIELDGVGQALLHYLTFGEEV
jgi:hypothetical protein